MCEKLAKNVYTKTFTIASHYILYTADAITDLSTSSMCLERSTTKSSITCKCNKNHKLLLLLVKHNNLVALVSEL